MLHAETPVTITMKALIVTLVSIAGIVVGAGGVLAGVFYYSLGHVRDNVGQLRQSVDSNTNRTRDIEVKFTEQIGGLRTDLATFSGKLDNVAARFESSVNGLTIRMDKFQTTPSWDPKALAEVLKKEGVDEQKIIIIAPR
jgi:hypothetical protein